MQRFRFFLFLSICCFSLLSAQRPLLLPSLVDDKWGYSDTNGVLVIPAQFDFAGEFLQSGDDYQYPLDIWYAAVRKGDAWNWIDIHGQKLFPYDSIQSIHSHGLNGQLGMVTLGIKNQQGQYSLTALIDARLRIARPFECVDFPELYNKKMLEYSPDWEKHEDYPSDSYYCWSNRDFGPNFLLEKCSKKANILQGIIDAGGHTLVEPVYAYISNIYADRYIAQPAPQSGYFVYNLSGKKILAFDFIPVTGINQGLIGVKKKYAGSDHYGFVDLEGKIVVPLQYTKILGFYQGLALGQRANENWDLIDVRGTVRLRVRKLEDIITYAHHFFIRQDSVHWQGYDYQFQPFLNSPLAFPPLPLRRNGQLCYRFSLGQDSVYVDVTGKELGRHAYDHVQRQSIYQTDKRPDSVALYDVRRAGKWGLAKRVDAYSFEEIITPRFDQTVMQYKNISYASIQGKWGAIDQAGRTIIPFEWDELRPSNMYFDRDTIGIRVKRAGRTGIFNTRGKVLVPCILQQNSYNISMDGNHIWLDSLNFVNYLCDGNGGALTFDSSYHFNYTFSAMDVYTKTFRPCFLVMHNHKMGFMNAQGSWLTPPVHEACRLSSSNRYIFTLDTAVWTMRERKTGEILFSSWESYETSVNDQVFISSYADEKMTYFIWLPSKKMMCPSPYRVQDFQEGLAVFRAENGFGFYNMDMKPVIKPDFQWAQGFENGCAIVQKNDHYGVIDHAGQVLIPLENTYIRRLKTNYFVVSKDSLRTVSLLKAGFKTLYTGPYSVDTLADNIFSVAIGKPGLSRDSFKYTLIDSLGNIIVERADKIFPGLTSLAYVKNGQYTEYGHQAGTPYREIFKVAETDWSKPPTDSVMWVGIVTAHAWCGQLYHGIQGIVKKDGTPVIPVAEQSIIHIPTTGDYLVYKDGKTTIFDQQGRAKSSFPGVSKCGLVYPRENPFCYVMTQPDPTDSDSRVDWWVTLSGKPIAVQKKRKCNQ